MVRKFNDPDAYGIKFGCFGSLPAAEPNLTPEQFAPLPAAEVEETHRRNLPTLVDIMEAGKAYALVDAGLNAFAHLPFGEPVSDAFVQKVVEKGIYVAPTIAAFPQMVKIFNGQSVPSPIEQACNRQRCYRQRPSTPPL